jgi:curli biogenesis system outer membrane secretion channel CsgG
MRIKTLFGVIAVIALGAFTAACGTADTDITASAPTSYQGPATVTGGSLIKQLKKEAPKANKKIVFAVGACPDKTGKYLDNEQLRYSRAVTQGCTDIIANILKMAGFNVAERDPYNVGLMKQEYELSHTFGPAPPCAPETADKKPAVPCTPPCPQKAGDKKPTVCPPGPQVNVGLIQNNIPDTGWTGANVLVTGAITAYDSSVNTGGGGAAYDGIGGSVDKSTAVASLALRFVDIPTSLVVSSMDEQTTVTGTQVDLHLTRFLGDVASSIATIASGGSGAATILAPQSNTHVLSAELGGAMQAPIDNAVIDSIVTSICRQLEVNPVFYTGPVKFDYNLPTN